MTIKQIAHIAHVAGRMFLRNAADPDLPNFWIAQAKAFQVDIPETSSTSRTEHGESRHPTRHAIDAR